MGSYRPVARIAIIGAGPSGLAAAKYLLAEKTFDRIDIFEQRSSVGGVWNLSSPERSRKIPVPQTNPRYGTLKQSTVESRQMYTDSEPESSNSLEFESPLYDYLETNIPKTLMQYSDKPFPTDLPLFPGHRAVLQYLEEYAEDVLHLIRFDMQVISVRLNDSDAADRWLLTAYALHDGRLETLNYDAVVVANGHYTVPYIPDVQGIEMWNKMYPGVILHSKVYRKPEDFKGHKVVVVGNSASGVDVAAQIAQYCQKPLFHCSRSEGALGPQSEAAWREDVLEVVEFLPPTTHDRAVRFKDGRVQENIDAVVFATGYFYNFPFLNLDRPIISDGFRTLDVYQHIFHIEHPTLAFPVLNLKVIPFPLAENQMAVVARVWSGRLSLPSKEEMRNWERNRLEERGGGKKFHVLKHPEDAEVLNSLYKWAKSASKAPGLNNEGVGKQGTYWDERKVWLRSQFPAIKAAFANRGEGRTNVKTAEELGFVWEDGKDGSSKQLSSQ